MRTSYCACDAKRSPENEKGQAVRCALEGRRRGPRTRRTRREIAETARHAQRRSRGAPGRVATRDTPGLGVGTPRVPTPGTVTDPPTPSRSTSAARGTRVAPNEEACRTTPDFGKNSFRSFERAPDQFRAHNDADMSSRTPARSRQALMSPKSTTTAGGWRCDPLVNANVTRHDACRQSRDCASSPATAEVGSLQFFFGPVRVPTDTRSSRGKRARPALTQPPSSPLPEPQGEGPQGHEGRVPRRHGRRSGAAGASPPRSCAREARETFGPTPSLIAPPSAFAFSSPRRRSIGVFREIVFFFFFFRNTFARFVAFRHSSLTASSSRRARSR